MLTKELEERARAERLLSCEEEVEKLILNCDLTVQSELRSVFFYESYFVFDRERTHATAPADVRGQFSEVCSLLLPHWVRISGFCTRAVFQAYELPAVSPVFTSHLSTGVLGLQMHATACHFLLESLELNCLLACTAVLVPTEQRPACIAQRLKAHTYSCAIVCPLRCWAFPSIMCWSTPVISAPKRNWKQEVQGQAGLWDTVSNIRLEIHTN